MSEFVTFNEGETEAVCVTLCGASLARSVAIILQIDSNEGTYIASYMICYTG